MLNIGGAYQVEGARAERVLAVPPDEEEQHVLRDGRKLNHSALEKVVEHVHYLMFIRVNLLFCRVRCAAYQQGAKG